MDFDTLKLQDVQSIKQLKKYLGRKKQQIKVI
jgi:hypothetical protein